MPSEAYEAVHEGDEFFENHFGFNGGLALLLDI
jgi:hypothetical protein